MRSADGLRGRCPPMLRAARSAAAATVAEVAAAAASQPSAVWSQLLAINARSTCANHLADIATAPGRSRPVALTDRRCPPAARRAAVSCGFAVAECPSAAGWHTRSSLSTESMTRRGWAQNVNSAGATPERAPGCPPALLRNAARSPSHDAAIAAAANQSCPPNLLSRLGRHRHFYVRRCVASNSRCPPETLAALSDDDDIGVRTAVAASAGTDSNLLDKLAGDWWAGVRTGAATNPNCTEGMLERLGADEDPAVRRAAAQHQTCNEPTLTKLRRDPDRQVRLNTAATTASRTARHRP